jgi:hypothetical protein
MTKTIEQERGTILSKRLEVLNEYLISESNLPFGEWLKSKNISVDGFNAELPDDHKFAEIGRMRVFDEDEKEILTDYTEDLNTLYFEQYLAHQEKKAETLNCDGCDNSCDGCSHYANAVEAELIGGVLDDGSDTMSYYAGGKFFKKLKKKVKTIVKNVKDKRKDVKAAKKEKKATKKKIRSDRKSGKLTRSQARAAKKSARKVMRDKVGSAAGRAIGTLNKLNPTTLLMRNSFLSLVAINAAGIASAFRFIKKSGSSHWKKMIKKWEFLGGDKSMLGDAIENGAKKKPFPNIKKRKHSAAGGDEEMTETELSDPKNAGKVAAGAGGALAGLAGLLASNPATAPAAVYVGSAGVVIGIASPILKDFAKGEGEDVSRIPDVAVPTEQLDSGTKDMLEATDIAYSETSMGDFFQEYKWWMLGGFALVATIGTLLAFSGGKKK